MCLAIPAKVTELKDGNLAQVDIMGVAREIAVDLTPQVEAGDYVLVHAGFSIEVVDEQFAQETIDLIRQFPELAGLDAPQDDEAEAVEGAEGAGAPEAGVPEAGAPAEAAAPAAKEGA